MKRLVLAALGMLGSCTLPSHESARLAGKLDVLTRAVRELQTRIDLRERPVESTADNPPRSPAGRRRDATNPARDESILRRPGAQPQGDSQAPDITAELHPEKGASQDHESESTEVPIGPPRHEHNSTGNRVQSVTPSGVPAEVPSGVPSGVPAAAASEGDSKGTPKDQPTGATEGGRSRNNDALLRLQRDVDHLRRQLTEKADVAVAPPPIEAPKNPPARSKPARSEVLPVPGPSTEATRGRSRFQLAGSGEAAWQTVLDTWTGVIYNYRIVNGNPRWTPITSPNPAAAK